MNTVNGSNFVINNGLINITAKFSSHGSALFGNNSISNNTNITNCEFSGNISSN